MHALKLLHMRDDFVVATHVTRAFALARQVGKHSHDHDLA